MYSKFRLVRGELRKTFVRPAIFAMTAIFIVAMVFSALLFKPTPRQDSRISLNAKSVSEVETAFYAETGASTSKLYFDNYLQKNAVDMLQAYSNPPSSQITAESIRAEATELKRIYDSEYKRFIRVGGEEDMGSIIQGYNKLNSALVSFEKTLGKINPETTYPTVYITIQDYNLLLSYRIKTESVLNRKGSINDFEFHMSCREQLDENDYFNKMKFICDDNIETIKIGQDLVNSLNKEYLETAQTRLNKIDADFQDFVADIRKQGSAVGKLQTNIDKAKEYLTQYKQTVEQVVDIVRYTLYINICSNLDVSTIKNYKGEMFTKYETYKYNEILTKNQYLYANKTFEYQYANVFQAGFSSTYETNAFDYMIYAMELLSILVVLFCVIFGADAIAGEHTNGTLKLLAIRPYKRRKIISAKTIATMLTGVIFLIIGMVASFIIGAFSYGIDMTNVLVTFNATTTFSLSPVLLMLIYLMCLFVRIAFYTIIAIFLSTIFRNSLIAMAISFVSYLLVALFAGALKTSPIYKYIPFNNFDLFKYFGNEFQNNGINNTIFGLDFTPPLVMDMTFFSSLLNIAIFGAIIYTITLIVFKKRDII